MTSQILQIKGHYCLIDCGEGTQYQLKQFNVKVSKIKYIFISHLHGDHYFGLPGLLSSFNLLGRKEPIYIYGPAALRDVLVSINKASGAIYSFKINFIDTQASNFEKLIDTDDFSVSSFPLDHRIACTGFLFQEKSNKAKLMADKIPENFPFELRRALKEGKTVTWNGTTYYHSDFTLPPAKPKSYAFCSDTAYNEDIIGYIHGAELLYHEATFNNDDLHRAIKTRHSTAAQAAQIALNAAVGQLIIGHFSVRYRELEELLQEAQNIFPNTKLAVEGELFYL